MSVIELTGNEWIDRCQALTDLLDQNLGSQLRDWRESTGSPRPLTFAELIGVAWTSLIGEIPDLSYAEVVGALLNLRQRRPHHDPQSSVEK